MSLVWPRRALGAWVWSPETERNGRGKREHRALPRCPLPSALRGLRPDYLSRNVDCSSTGIGRIPAERVVAVVPLLRGLSGLRVVSSCPDPAQSVLVRFGFDRLPETSGHLRTESPSDCDEAGRSGEWSRGVTSRAAPWRPRCVPEYVSQHPRQYLGPSVPLHRCAH